MPSMEIKKKTPISQKRFVEDTAAFLYDELSLRKARNSQYSIRAFARDLEISPAFMSQVLNKKRNFSLAQKMKIAGSLGLSLNFGNLDAEADLNPLELRQIEQSIEHEKILKYWYHFAILSLAQIETLPFKPEPTAKRLGIESNEASSAIERLIEFGYLERKGKMLIRTQTPFVIDAKKSSHALRQLHRTRLSAAEQELENFTQPRIDRRFFQTLFIPASREKARLAKTMILNFQNELIKFLMADSPDEIFQLSLQLFSVDTSEDRNSKP